MKNFFSDSYLTFCTIQTKLCNVWKKLVKTISRKNSVQLEFLTNTKNSVKSLQSRFIAFRRISFFSWNRIHEKSAHFCLYCTIPLSVNFQTLVSNGITFWKGFIIFRVIVVLPVSKIVFPKISLQNFLAIPFRKRHII